QRGESALEHRFRAASIVLGQLHLVAPAVRIDADARAAGPAEKIVDRLLCDLSDDVPQRLLDPGRGAIKLQRAASLRIIIQRDLNHVADMERVAANKIAAKLLHLHGDGTVAVVLTVRLAPSDDPGIGCDPHEHETSYAIRNGLEDIRRWRSSLCS